MDDPNMHAYGGEGPDDAEIGRRWREDSSLEKWFPLTAERLVALEAENAALKREAHTCWTAAHDTARWRDAAKETPRNGQEVLATIYPYRNKINRQMIVHAVYVDAAWLDPADREPLHEPTHWMPAPTLPDGA